jgi:cytochrome c oxidase subunit 2
MYWETANYELACAELCGIGHWSMKKKVTILEEDEYEEWLADQKSYYLSNIRGTEGDPNTNMLLPAEITQRRQEFNQEADTALETSEDDDNTLTLEYVTFETGSEQLTEFSSYQLDDAINFLKENADVSVMLKGHTDNTGDATVSYTLSDRRATEVRMYLLQGGIDAQRMSSAGYGLANPVADNATEDGRQANRRTELYVTRGALPASTPSK